MNFEDVYCGDGQGSMGRLGASGSSYWHAAKRSQESLVDPALKWATGSLDDWVAVNDSNNVDSRLPVRFDRWAEPSNGKSGDNLRRGTSYQKITKKISLSEQKNTVDLPKRDYEGLEPSEWKNVSPVIRSRFVQLNETVLAQGEQIIQLTKTIDSLKTFLQKDSDDKLHRMRSDYLAILEEMSNRMRRTEDQVSLKADTTYVTSCILAKADRSDIDKANSEANQRISKVEADYKIRSDTDFDTLKAYQKALLSDIQSEAKNRAANIEEQMDKLNEQICIITADLAAFSGCDEKRFESVFDDYAWKKLDERIFSKLIEAQQSDNPIFEASASKQKLQEFKRQLRVNAFNLKSMQKKVESLQQQDQPLFVGSSEMPALETALQSKASRGDLANLEGRIIKLESNVEASLVDAEKRSIPDSQKSESPGKWKEVEKIQSRLGTIEETLDDVPINIGRTLKNINENVNKEVSMLRLELERMKGKVSQIHNNSQPINSQSVDGFNKRMRSVVEMCSKNLQRISLLQDRVTTLEQKFQTYPGEMDSAGRLSLTDDQFDRCNIVHSQDDEPMEPKHALKRTHLNTSNSGGIPPPPYKNTSPRSARKKQPTNSAGSAGASRPLERARGKVSSHTKTWVP